MWLERMRGGGEDLITLADAKSHLRVIENDSDAEISNAISAASSYLDVDADGFGGLGSPLVSQSWVIRAGTFGTGSIRLPFSRVTAITAITYHDASNVLQSVSAANYHLVGSGRDQLIKLAAGAQWPEVYDRPEAVIIVFEAGFEDVDAVPADIKAAARLLVGHFYENREAAGEGAAAREIALGVTNLTQRYRRFGA